MGTAKANKRVQFGYGLNYLTDIENAVIVDVEGTPARTYDEVAAKEHGRSHPFSGHLEAWVTSHPAGEGKVRVLRNERAEGSSGA